MSTDRILMRGLEFYGYHGVIPEENRLGQRFVVDIDMFTDTRAAGATDDLRKTIDYVAVHADIKRIVEGPALKLVETVAERIAAVILERDGVVRVRVRVRKPDVPMAASLKYVGVEIVRTRDVGPGT